MTGQILLTSRSRLPGNNNYKVLAAGAEKIGYKEFHSGNMAINSIRGQLCSA